MTGPRPWVEAEAPATVSNLGPGFDCLGLAIAAWHDRVRARRRDAPGVAVLRVSGEPGLGAERLPTDPARNTAAVAATHLLRRFAPGAGVELEVHKGLPLGSGLGSSGASAIAAAVAVDALLGLDAGETALVEAGRAGEAVACGTPHPDNVAPALLGGVVLVAGENPLRLLRLPAPEGLHLAVYTPGCSVATADARAALPARVPVADAVAQAARLAMLVHGLHREDAAMVGEAMVDRIAEPARAHLIPGYVDAKAACVEAGALACSISGAGPTVFALAPNEGRAGALLEILADTFTLAGVPGRGAVTRVGPGARIISRALH